MIATKSTTPRLKNKFQDIENSISEREHLPEIEPSPIFDNTKPEKEISKNYSGFIIRFLKLTATFVSSWSLLIWHEIISPIGKKVYKIFIYSFKKYREVKTQSEIIVDSQLVKAEASIQRKALQIKQHEDKIKDDILMFKKEIGQYFSIQNTKVEFSCGKSDFSKVSASFEFDLTLYEFIASKLSESKMITNVSSVSVICHADDKKIINTIDFEINQQCEKWSGIFSKFISSEIQKRIVNYQGVVENSLTVNIIKKVEVFRVVFAHERLDCYVQNAQEEKPIVQKNLKSRYADLEV